MKIASMMSRRAGAKGPNQPSVIVLLFLLLSLKHLNGLMTWHANDYQKVIPAVLAANSPYRVAI